MMFFFGLLNLLILGLVQGQQKGTQTKEEHPKFSIQECTKSNGCTPEAGSVVMDGNWRWTHKAGDWKPNCYDGAWNPDVCPDPATCTKNCAIDGITADGYSNTYGVKTPSDSEVQLDFVTKDSTGKVGNVGSRVYFLAEEKKYKMFKLINKEFTFDVDVSKLGCGLNGAVYFVEMPEDGGMAKFPTNKAGAAYGTGYCDAQCPHGIKWINGEANLNQTGEVDGHYGTCCSEMDIWEANKMASAFTPHPCAGEGRVRCEGDTCKNTCDAAGCDFNTFRMGNKTFFSEGSSYIDTSKPLTLVTQFISSDGTDDGDLIEIKRIYVQDGKVINNAFSHLESIPKPFNSLTDANCDAQKTAFKDDNTFKTQGGMKKIGESLKRGMVLVMSLWDDTEVYMLWLDSNFPVDAPTTQPGVPRGPCSIDSGRPADVEVKQADANVKYSNIKYGEIGSTYKSSN